MRYFVVVGALVWSFCAAAQSTSKACPNEVAMQSFTVCLPSGWYWERETKNDLLKACNKVSGECTGNGGGFPLKGAVFLFIAPAELLPGKTKSLDAIVEREAKKPLDEKTVVDVPIGPDKRCVLVRSRMKPTSIWNDVYGVQAGPLLVRAWAQYREEPGFRETIVQVLRSISPR